MAESLVMADLSHLKSYKMYLTVKKYPEVLIAQIHLPWDLDSRKQAAVEHAKEVLRNISQKPSSNFDNKVNILWRRGFSSRIHLSSAKTARKNVDADARGEDDIAEERNVTDNLPSRTGSVPDTSAFTTSVSTDATAMDLVEKETENNPEIWLT